MSTVVSPAGADSAGIERSAVAEEIASVAGEAQEKVPSAMMIKMTGKSILSFSL